MYMRNGYTILELIFVIVIIGLLAAIAVSKLTATRDDAAVVSELNKATKVLINLGSEYIGQGRFVNYLEEDANNETRCFSYTITWDGNVTVSLKDVYDKCPELLNKDVKRRASKNGLLSIDGSEKKYQFGSTFVKY